MNFFIFPLYKPKIYGIISLVVKSDLFNCYTMGLCSVGRANGPLSRPFLWDCQREAFCLKKLQKTSKFGPVAQLGERSVRIREVESSNLFRSTRWTLDEHLLFQRRLCRDGVALMSAELRTEDLSSVLIFSHHLCKILVVLYISLSSSKYKK